MGLILSMKKYLLIETDGPVLWIYLNRPEVKNAFNLEMAEELQKAIQKGIKDDSVSVLVLSGRGDTFSAGGDIRLMKETRDRKRFFLKISRIINQAVVNMQKGGKPVLAALPGYTGGIALGLALGTDIRIASTHATFNAATIRLGLVANGGTTSFLPRLVGTARAAEILFAGESIGANRAEQIGLINHVVTPEELKKVTQELALKLSQGPQQALRRLKQIFYQGLHSPLPAQLERERQAIAWSATTPDFEEGITAFLEKRKPLFK